PRSRRRQHRAEALVRSQMILDERAVHDLLSMEELIPAMAKAMADLSSDKVVQPGRVMLPVAEHQGFLGLMPAYGGALGAKLVAFYPNNQGIPSHHAMILLFKPETGEPLVTMDGRLITEMRTAAAAAGGAWLAPGTHINAVGAPRPTWRELDDDALRKARLYVEQREAATRESGDVIAAGKIFAEIGEVVAGSKPGRQSADEITLYKSVGVAVQDIVSAELVYRTALKAGIF